MGGVLPATLTYGGFVLSTAASLLGNDKAERDYYKSMASTAEKQAKQIEETAQRNMEYMFQDTSYQNTQLNREYRQLVGQQKNMLAGSGISSQSATAQLILKNSRLNAEMDQEMLNANMNRAMYETNTQAALEAQQYRTEAKQYRKLRKNRTGFIDKIGSGFNSFFQLFG